MRPALLVLAALAVGSVAGCGDSDEGTSAPGALVVVATTTQLADVARVVGGDDIDLYSVLKPNADAHDFEPGPADLEALDDAAVIIRNGAGLESWFDDAVAASGGDGTVVTATDGIELHEGHDDGDDHGDVDPHVWFDPQNMVTITTAVETALSAADPAHATDYETRAAAYRAELEQLDADIAAEIATLPNRKVVTTHDAFGYYFDRYGLDLVGTVIPTFDSSAEPSASDLDDLVATIRAEGVKAVFTEASLPAGVAEALAEEAGVRVVTGDDALYGDSLGPAGSAGDTYLKMMRHNTDAIVSNLR